MYKRQVNKLFPIHEDLGVEIVWYDDIENPIDRLAKIVKAGEVLGVDKDLRATFLIDLMDRNVVKTFTNSSPIIDMLRAIKDAEEIQIIDVYKRQIYSSLDNFVLVYVILKKNTPKVFP